MKQFETPVRTQPLVSNHPMLQSESERQFHAVDDNRDLFMSPVVASGITFVLLFVSALGTRWLEDLTRDPRPFTLFFLVPVAFSAAFFGVRGGLAVSLLSLIITRFYLFPSTGISFEQLSTDNIVEMCALAFGTLTVSVVTGRLRSVLSQLRQANSDLRDSELRRKNFTSEVLLAVTGGILELCDVGELQQKIRREPDAAEPLKEPKDVSQLRHKIVNEIMERHYASLRVEDLTTAVTEAASNAVKHGGGGNALVWFDPDSVSVLIQDHGAGISPAQLARATLERGYSTRVSLGMGYYMILESVDRLALNTSPAGTSILLTVGGSNKSTVEQNIVNHYSPI